MNARDSILSLDNSALVTQDSALSSDDLIRPLEHADWNCQTNLFCRFEVDNEFKLRRLLRLVRHAKRKERTLSAMTVICLFT